MSTSSTSKVPRPVILSIIGTGLVGSELIAQVLALGEDSPFTIASLSSSKKTLFVDPTVRSHIEPSTWKSALAGSAHGTDHAALVRYVAGLARSEDGDSKNSERKARVVVVDNTASADVAALYPLFLRAGASVVTPNKKAFSGPLALYEDILAAAREGGWHVRYLHEATVGAGLPVVQTLKDLVATGDRVIKIEGVFSGTLSYIFNEFSPVPGKGSAPLPSFSSVVREAREKGYTEPNPADDLSGSDVARKLTILARLVPPLARALPDGFASVATASLVPTPLASASGDEFVARLSEFDAEWDGRRGDAAREGCVLRYVGVVDVQGGVIKAGLEKYPVTHPFATSLGGSDNIIMFHTERYGARPLIVQGAGAGAAVTAMGVLGDLFKLV